ncbi:MAG: MATE family efflux transporter [Lachnospiraceae bacterium]|nr:MATE family efflux transporter [Ruminococcus sp.]MCM1277009.1 MATE family efflux transporter [Lachnospiraceae bacterium]
MNDTEKQNKMGTLHEGKLLISMGIPLMLSMLVTALYNIVDTFFVSQIEGTGDAAANALSLAFPIQMLMTALNVGTGVGIGASLSRALGCGDRERVGKTAGNGMFLYTVYYFVMLVFGLFAAKPFIALFSDDPDVLNFGTVYLGLVTCLSFGNMGEKCFEKLLQATGKTTYSMIGQLTGSVINIVLDPIFIFGYFGIPAMGAAGAAIATVIGQCCAIVITASLHFRKNTEITNRLEYLKPDAEILSGIMKVGAPAILMQALTGFMTLGMNFILKGVSAAAVTAYGVYYKLQNFIFMPAFGLNNACVPIVGYNVGAKRYDRVKNTIKYAIFIVFIIMALGLVLFQCFAPFVVGVFKLSEDISSLCVSALHIISTGFIFAGVNVLLQGVCQALGGGIVSLIISALRLIIGVLPSAAVLAALPGAENFIWIVFPIAETVSFAVVVVLTLRLYRKTTRIRSGG